MDNYLQIIENFQKTKTQDKTINYATDSTMAIPD